MRLSVQHQICGASLLMTLGLCGCGPGRWAVVNITDDEATLLRIDDVRRTGPRASFTAAVLEHTPRLLDGQLTDYWTQKASVDCAARTYRLGETAGFRADGRQLAIDSQTDADAPLRPASIEAAEAAAVCGDHRNALPAASPGGLQTLLHQFRTGTILPSARRPAVTTG